VSGHEIRSSAFRRPRGEGKEKGKGNKKLLKRRRKMPRPRKFEKGSRKGKRGKKKTTFAIVSHQIHVRKKGKKRGERRTYFFFFFRFWNETQGREKKKKGKENPYFKTFLTNFYWEKNVPGNCSG